MSLWNYHHHHHYHLNTHIHTHTHTPDPYVPSVLGNNHIQDDSIKQKHSILEWLGESSQH